MAKNPLNTVLTFAVFYAILSSMKIHNDTEENKSLFRNKKEERLYLILAFMLVFGVLFASINQAYENKPAIYYHDSVVYKELPYSSHSSEKVGWSDLSYYYEGESLGIETRITETDVPMEIKVTQGAKEYSIFVNAPGAYKIPLPEVGEENISTDFVRKDGTHHALSFQPTGQPKYLDTFPALSDTENTGKAEVIK